MMGLNTNVVKFGLWPGLRFLYVLQNHLLDRFFDRPFKRRSDGLFNIPTNCFMKLPQGSRRRGGH
jgi:hypothetical protein